VAGCYLRPEEDCRGLSRWSIVDSIKTQKPKDMTNVRSETWKSRIPTSLWLPNGRSEDCATERCQSFALKGVAGLFEQNILTIPICHPSYVSRISGVFYKR